MDDDSKPLSVERLHLDNSTHQYVEDPRKYIIWPSDGLQVDTLQALLDSFPDISLHQQISVTGGGVIYWLASLTLAQVAEIEKEKECESTELCIPVDSESDSDDGDEIYFLDSAGNKQQQRRYTIWPLNGLDVDSLQALLDTFPGIESRAKISPNGEGVICWKASFIPPQVAEIEKESQCRSVQLRTHSGTNLDLDEDDNDDGDD